MMSVTIYFMRSIKKQALLNTNTTKKNSTSLIYICSRKKSDSFHTLLNTLATDNNSVNHENWPKSVQCYSINTHFLRNKQNQSIILNKSTFYIIILCLLNDEK